MTNNKAIESKPVYRIMLLAECEPYDHGDYYDEGGNHTPESQVAGEAEVNALIDQHGVWGFVVEKRVHAGEKCISRLNGRPGVASWSRWEHVDSCFGFIGNDDYMLSEALTRIPAGCGEVSIVGENGREINTATK